MINVRTAELLVSMITFLLAYMVVATIAGAFRAWVAKKMGDNTAESLGLLTLNPFASLSFIDLLGLGCLLFFSFGWGRYVPINPLKIKMHLRVVRLNIAYFADTVAYLVLGILSIVVLIALGGPQILMLAGYMLMGMQNMSHLYLVSTYPELSSMVVMFAFIAMACTYLSIMFAVLSFIIDCFDLLMFFMMERSLVPSYSTMLVPLILMILFAGPLRQLVINIISYTGYGIAKVFYMV